MTTTLAPGTMVGSLRVERELGEGAFAHVYLAHDMRLRRDVALKVLTGRPDSAHSTRFLEEARVVASLHSPHIVTLFQLHERAPGEFLIEMEYVPGGSLEEAIGNGLPIDRAERIIRGLLAALQLAHDRGILHRDIKPANVLLADDGTAKLSDFGLARLDEEVEFGDDLLGTPLYMAPELLLGESASIRTDLWSLGVTAYRMLTGRFPFARENAIQYFSSVQNEEPDPLPPSIPSHLRELVARCLVKHPPDRAADCAELLEALDDPTLVVREPGPERATDAFYGREEELARIAEHDTVLLVGPAGIGKTALCAEARRRASGVVWIDARLSPVEGPLVALVRAARLAALTSSSFTVSQLGPARSFLRKALTGDSLPALENRQQALSTLEQLLSGIAREKRLVLCIDDGQHASEEDVALLNDVGRRLRQRVIVATRPGSVIAASLERAERIALAGLDRDSLVALLEERLGTRLEAKRIHSVVRRSDGNPLIALELARTGDDSVPARLRDILEARLAKLDEEDRSLLEFAAVDGREFDGRALAAVLGAPVLQVLRRLQNLCRAGNLITPGEPGYRFTDAALQDVLYEDLAPELRTELHRALARHLEARDEQVAADRLARHWEGCGERDAAAPYLCRMADAARFRQESHRVAELCERAGMLEDPPRVDLEEWRPLATRFAETLVQRGRAGEAEGLIGRIRAALTEERARIELEVDWGRIAMTQRGMAPRLDEAHWRRCAEQLGETRGGAHAMALVGHVAKRRADFDTAWDAFQDSLRIHEALGDDLGRSSALGQLGAVAMRRGEHARAIELFREAADLAEHSGLATSAAVNRTNAALAAMLGGMMEGAEHDVERAARTFDVDGSIALAAQARLYLAEIRFARGELADALAVAQSVLPDLERVGNRLILANARRIAGLLLLARDRVEEGSAMLARAVADAEASQDPAQLGAACAAQALAHTMAGRLDDAHAAGMRALEAGRGTTQPSGEVVLLLAEAALFGLPTDLLEAAGDLTLDENDRALRESVLRGDAGAVEKLRERTRGLRGASIRLLAAWVEGPEPAREAAAAMGHLAARRVLAG